MEGPFVPTDARFSGMTDTGSEYHLMLIFGKSSSNPGEAECNRLATRNPHRD